MKEANKDKNWELISKKLGNGLGDAEEKEFSQWLEQDASNRKEMDRAQKIWDLSNQQGIDEFNTNNGWVKMQNRIRNTSERKNNHTFKIPAVLFKVAAALLVLVALAYMFGYILGKTNTIEYTAATNMKNKPIILADGSKVYLNKGAQISYPKKFKSNTRNVELTGEAFFEVARNEKQPFVIKTKTASIKVLGTSFNVLACNNCDSIQVDVKTGLVELWSGKNTDKILISKGNTGVYYISPNQLKLSTTDINMNRFAWKTDSIIFQDSRLYFVAKTLERIFGEKIIINSEKLKQCPITANFKEQDLQQILKSIEVSHGLHVNKTNLGYILTGTECK